jgi:competence protein ComEA
MTSGCYRSTANTPPQEPNVVLGALNINTATAEELVTIPNIGEKLAVRIVEFRERNGRFQRPEDLLLVPGISDKRFREIRNMIRTE